MTTPQRIEQAKTEEFEDPRFLFNGETECYKFRRSELNALLLQLQDEQKETDIEVFLSKEFTSAKTIQDKIELLKNAPYAYEPNKEEL